MFLLGLIAGIVGCSEPEQGPQGVAGQTGATGPQGPRGDTGATGPAGADGQPARVVQLCPGVTVYPSAFVEVALCINNQLYAVYSANGGFLTHILPGLYNSNAIGSACSFTVVDSCLVTN